MNPPEDSFSCTEDEMKANEVIIPVCPVKIDKKCEWEYCDDTRANTNRFTEPRRGGTRVGGGYLYW